jgi:hypothetical protein
VSSPNINEITIKTVFYFLLKLQHIKLHPTADFNSNSYQVSHVDLQIASFCKHLALLQLNRSNVPPGRALSTPLHQQLLTGRRSGGSLAPAGKQRLARRHLNGGV